jgi:hypothetical protein
MGRLETLCLRPRWTYEVVVSTFSDDLPHATPIGVWTDETPDSLHMEIYEASETLRNVLANKCLVVNFPPDVVSLSTALLSPGRLAFGQARKVRAPVLRDASAVVELVLDSATVLPGRMSITGLAVHTERRRTLQLVNRADSLLLESLILATRREMLDRSFVASALVENYRVIRKVAPGSAIESSMSELLRSLGLPS